jgi:hypothetical protein
LVLLAIFCDPAVTDIEEKTRSPAARIIARGGTDEPSFFDVIERSPMPSQNGIRSFLDPDQLPRSARGLL